MSAIDVSNLKSVFDEFIPNSFHQEEIALAEIKFDTLYRFGKLIQHGRIINKDSVNPITYRAGGPLAPLQEIPPNSDETFDGWFSKIIITPNAVTGSGFLELDLASPEDARKDGR